MSEEPQKVPARRRKDAQAVDLPGANGGGGAHVEPGDAFEEGVWPWEITEEHGWEPLKASAPARSEPPQPAKPEGGE